MFGNDLWMHLLVVFSFIGLLVTVVLLVILNVYYYASSRKEHIRLWTLGCSIYMLGGVLRHAILLSTRQTIYHALTDLLSLISITIIMRGVLICFGKHRSKGWVYSSYLAVIWAIGGFVFRLPHLVVELPIDAYVSTICIYTGITIKRAIKTKRFSSMLVSLLFIIYGVNYLGHTFADDSFYLLKIFFAISLILEILIVVGVLSIYIRNLREEFVSKQEVYRKGEERLNTIIENQRDVIFEVDKDGVFTFVSPSSVDVLGYKPEEIIGHPYVEFISQGDYKSIEEINEKNYSLEIKWKHPDGSIRYLSLSLKKMTGNSKGIYGGFGSARDITDYRKAQTELMESEKRYRELFNDANDAIFLYEVSEDGIPKLYSDANNIACKQLGYSKDELLKMTPLDVYDKMTLAKVRKNIRDIIKIGYLMFEEFHLSKSGVRIPVEVSAHSFLLNDKRFILSIARDISERKRWEKQISKLSNAVEQSSNTVIITDVNTNIEYVNSRFTEITGYEAAEVIGKKVDELLDSGYHSPQFISGIKKMMLAGKQWRGEKYYKKKNSECFWLLVSMSPIRNEEGIITNFLELQQDITEQKQMEQMLKDSNGELKNIIGELERTQIQLIQQEKLAGIGQLAAGVAHEINNPMGFICSNFDTLKGYFGKIGEMIYEYNSLDGYDINTESGIVKEKLKIISELKAKNHLDIIVDDIYELFDDTQEGLKRVEQIVKSLRLFSRADQINKYEEYDLNIGIENTLIIANNEVKYHAKVETHLGCIPLIEGIGGQINQVILNIIINSVQAIKSKSPQEGGMICISTFSDNNYVSCEIEDNGIGIEKDILRKIFDPFFTSKPAGEGTGLGLSIAYDIIVNKHRGELTVESTPGIGTKFTIKLPVKQKHLGN